MKRYLNHVFPTALLLLGLNIATPAVAATATEVPRATWAGSASLPSYVKMYIYVPQTVASKPPILVSSHSCGSTAEGQMGNIPKSIAAADKYGFIIILPDNPGRNCWDVGNATSLKHDGGGDTQAVAQMVKYAITKYNADPTRVYAMGGSSGGMMTQALMAVYPDVFKAGHARAGVPAGCWAVDYKPADQWSDTCKAGNVTKTAQQWGDLARSYFPGYTGHRPRIQLVQGTADTTIVYKNMGESIKQWTNVLGLSETPTSTQKSVKGDVATYDVQYWKNSCGFTVLEAWSAPGGSHSMGYEETAMLKFFGLDSTVGGPDPEDAACAGDAGVPPGSGGAGGAGGSIVGSGGAGGGVGAGGAAGAKDGSVDGRNGGSGGVQAEGGGSGSGGTTTTGGRSGSGGTVAAGGDSGSGGSGTGSGGRSGSGGSNETGGGGGTQASGGNVGSGGVSGGSGGSASQGGSGSGGASATTDETANGCDCRVNHARRAPGGEALLLLLPLALILRRWRRPGR